MKSFRRWFGGKEYENYINWFHENNEAVPPFLFLCPYEERNKQDGWMVPCEENHPNAEDWTDKDKSIVKKANKYLGNINRIHNG